MLSRTGRKILDHNLVSIIRMDGASPSILDELVLDLHEYPDLVVDQIVNHRFFRDFFYGILKIMDVHTPKFPRVAGNAAYVLGALLDNDVGRKKVVLFLRDEDQSLETQRCLPNLGALIETFDLEAMTNASGTASLIFECEESRDWALEQPSCEWLIYTLARALLDTDMWVASNCALTLARICMCENGKKLVINHKEAEFITVQLIMSTGVDSGGRGMNAAFAIAYLCEDEDQMHKISYMKESLDLDMGLINMLRSVDEGCRKNALFCLKTMSGHKDGKDQLNGDPDIETLMKLLCNSLSCGDEDLGKMASVTLANLAESKEGYMLQKDHSPAKTSLQHVLTNMNISEEYRTCAFEAMKSLMIPKPDPPSLRVKDAYTVMATWEPVTAKSGNEVQYELYCDEKMVYTGTELSHTITKLKERTEYAFQLRAFTDDDEESFVSEEVKIKTFRAIASPPVNVRPSMVTSSRIQLVWKRPTKFCGTLKHYSVREKGAGMDFNPTLPYLVVSNLEANKEYTFEICAVTQRGRGELATVKVKTLKKNDKAPCNIKLVANGSHEIAVKWDKPKAPASRINGYEVLCNGKAIYFGTTLRCVATNLHPDTKYNFKVVAWTSDGKNESEPFYRKTAGPFKVQPKSKPFQTQKDLEAWLEAKDDNNELDVEQDEEEFEEERNRAAIEDVEDGEQGDGEDDNVDDSGDNDFNDDGDDGNENNNKENNDGTDVENKEIAQQEKQEELPDVIKRTPRGKEDKKDKR